MEIKKKDVLAEVRLKEGDSIDTVVDIKLNGKLLAKRSTHQVMKGGELKMVSTPMDEHKKLNLYEQVRPRAPFTWQKVVLPLTEEEKKDSYLVEQTARLTTLYEFYMNFIRYAYVCEESFDGHIKHCDKLYVYSPIRHRIEEIPGKKVSPLGCTPAFRLKEDLIDFIKHFRDKVHEVTKGE